MVPVLGCTEQTGESRAELVLAADAMDPNKGEPVALPDVAGVLVMPKSNDGVGVVVAWSVTKLCAGTALGMERLP